MHQTLLYKSPISSAGGALSFETPAFGTGDCAAVLVTLQVHQIVGGANASVQMQTSGDGETYDSVGTPVVGSAVGRSSVAIIATTTPYQGFMRALVSLTPLDMSAVISIYVSLLPNT